MIECVDRPGNTRNYYADTFAITCSSNIPVLLKDAQHLISIRVYFLVANENSLFYNLTKLCTIHCNRLRFVNRIVSIKNIIIRSANTPVSRPRLSLETQTTM